MIEQVFGVGHQRRAQAARGHIAHAKIAYHGAAHALADYGGLAQLKGGANVIPQVPFRHRHVVQGLAVTAHQIHIPRRNPGGPAYGLAGLQRKLAKQEVEQAQLVRAAAFPARQTQNGLSHPGGIGQRYEGKLGYARAGTKALYARERGVHAIGGGAAHQADYQQTGLFQ